MPHIPGYPKWRCEPRKPGDTVPAFCRWRLLHSHPRPAGVMSQHSAPCSSQPTNLADVWSGFGAALTWPPAGSSSGAADLCPPEKRWTINSSKRCSICARKTRNVCVCACAQGHYAQATTHFWNKQRQQPCLDFLSGKLSFFCLLGRRADNSQKVESAL